VSISPKPFVGAMVVSGPANTRMPSKGSSWPSGPAGSSSSAVSTNGGGRVCAVALTVTWSLDVPIWVRPNASATPPETVTLSPTATGGVALVRTNTASDVAGSPSESGLGSLPTSDWT
jgi:hypothetical protein